MRIRFVSASLVGVALCILPGLADAGAPQEPSLAGQHWVASWGIAQQVAVVTDNYVPTLPTAPPDKTTLARLPKDTPPPGPFQRQTVRMVVRSTMAGSRIRFRFSCSFGSHGVYFWNAHVAYRDHGSAVVGSTDRRLTVLGGQPIFAIGPGAEIVSDPVDLAVKPGTELLVSLYVHLYTSPITEHRYSLQRAYVTDLDFTGDVELPNAKPVDSYFWLSGMDAWAPGSSSAVVAFGDSLTTGLGSTPEVNRDWPSLLAGRLQESKHGSISVINEGIAGNRLLRDGPDASAIARFDRQVLGCPGIRWVILQFGTYDLAMAKFEHHDLHEDELMAGLRQIIERAHSHGLKVIGATVPPFAGSFFDDDAANQTRKRLNEWIRHSEEWDGVIDFDQVLRDPQVPARLRADFDSGDHFLPNDAGYAAMAAAIDLTNFRSQPLQKN